MPQKKPTVYEFIPKLGQLRDDVLEAWRTRSLAAVDVIYVYLDGFALRVRSAVSVPVLGVVGVLADGGKQLLAQTRPWSCSSALWPAGRSSCAGLTAGGRSPRC